MGRVCMYLLVAMLAATLVGCGSSGGDEAPPPDVPGPAALVWDNGNWDEAVWQ